ncbi:MFS transporter [Streptomyces sp. NPDC018031]|uniref:MFS transporter n=1 Tax=Streptomyces sp. NPDC018031 TaxID=3365033 RepID=UPI0037B0D3EE
METEHSAGRRRALVAGSVGNFIEWFEFGVYGYFATIIAANFFTPEGGSEAEGLIKTYASFAVAFFFRPLGAALFGRLGDRIGRRPTLIAVLLLMTGATTLIGVLPTRATAGAAAPWLLTLVRAVQGLSAGGEFGGAVSVMTEFAPPGRRGLYGAWQSFTVALGLLAGAGLAALLGVLLSEEALYDWGWRLPFLLTLPLGLAALWLRLRLAETPAFGRARAAAEGGGPAPGPPPGTAAPGTAGIPSPGTAAPGTTPPGTAAPGLAGITPPGITPPGITPPGTTPPGVAPPGTAAPGTGSAGTGASGVPRRPGRRETARAIALGSGRLMGWSAAGYTFLVVMPSYLQATLDVSFTRALAAAVLANLGFACSILPAGALSDRIGRRPVMLAGALLVVVSTFPLMNLLQDPDTPTAVQCAAVFVAGATVGLMAGPGPAMLAEMFPTAVRYTGLGLAYSLSNAVFSGCAGLIITELIEHTHNADIPAYYTAVTCGVSVFALLTLRGDDHRRALRE